MAKTGRSLFLPGQFKPQLAWLGRNLPTLCMSLSRVGCTAQRCHSSSCLSIPLSPINPKRKVPRNLKHSGNMCPNVCDWHRRFVQKGQGWMMHSPTEFSNRQCTGGLWRRCCSVVREFFFFLINQKLRVVTNWLVESVWHNALLQQLPAHQALWLQTNISTGRNPGISWKRLPGRLAENMDFSDSRWYWNVITCLLECLHSSWSWKRDGTVSEDYALMMMTSGL